MHFGTSYFRYTHGLTCQNFIRGKKKEEEKEEESQCCHCHFTGKEPGVLSSRGERCCHSVGGRTQRCCDWAGPSVSPILTVSLGDASLAASITGSEKGQELSSVGLVLDTSLVRTWSLPTVLCPLDAQKLLLPPIPYPCGACCGILPSPVSSCSLESKWVKH